MFEKPATSHVQDISRRGESGVMDIQGGSFYTVYYQDTKSLFRALRSKSSEINM